ncbi:MAG: flavin oxidoreductase [Cytophagales bacterium]|nr:flavin oxidoreductase [Cytophagales bacterium]
MHLTKEDIHELVHVKRLNIINSITGIKPANLIGTISDDGFPNVAIFSSIIHLGSNPALIGFIIRPTGEVRRDTYNNIMENSYYTINHVHEGFTEKAHLTSAKFPKEDSEFDKCELTEEYLFDFKAPFVKESNVKLGMKFVQSVPIELNGTILVIGEIQHIVLPDEIVTEEGYIDLGQAEDVGISGLNRYYKLEKIGEYPYARPF